MVVTSARWTIALIGTVGPVLACAGPDRATGPTDTTSGLAASEVPPALVCPEPAPPAGASTDEIVLIEQSGPAVDPDASSGVATLCLGLAGSTPQAVDIDCRWSIDRREVIGLSTGSIRVGGHDVQVGLDRSDAPATSLRVSAVTPEGAVATYRTPIGMIDDGMLGTGVDGRLQLTVDVQPALDGVTFQPLDGAAGRPGFAVGLVWRCDPAPPPIAGQAVGRLSIHLDRPIGRTFVVDAECLWSRWASAERVVSISNWQRRIPYGPDTFIQVRIEAPDWLDLPMEGPDVALAVTDASGDRRSDYEVRDRMPYWLLQPPDLSAGHVRFRDLAMADASDPMEARPLGDLDATTVLSGWVRWSCAPPAAAPLAADREPDPATSTVEGRVGLDFDATLPGLVLAGPAICQIEPFEGEIYVPRLRATVRDGDRRSIVGVDRERLWIARVGADGTFLGDYEGFVREYGSILDGPFSTDVAGLSFVSDDPAYLPFSGDSGPVPITGARLTYGCEIPD